MLVRVLVQVFYVVRVRAGVRVQGCVVRGLVRVPVNCRPHLHQHRHHLHAHRHPHHTPPHTHPCSHAHDVNPSTSTRPPHLT